MNNLLQGDEAAAATEAEAATRARPLPEFLRRDQILTDVLPIGRTTFDQMIGDGRFPQPDRRIGRVRLWRRATVLRWVAADDQRAAARAEATAAHAG